MQSSQSPQPNYRERVAGQFAPRAVTPHWLAGGDKFWYRVDLGENRAQFVVVDAAKKTRRAAFDHDKLAELLTRELGQPIAADALPFTWISVAPDGAWTRFRIGEQAWQWNSNGVLARTQAAVNEETLARLDAPRASERTGDATAITFVNRTGKKLSLFCDRR